MVKRPGCGFYSELWDVVGALPFDEGWARARAGDGRPRLRDAQFHTHASSRGVKFPSAPMWTCIC